MKEDNVLMPFFPDAICDTAGSIFGRAWGDGGGVRGVVEWSSVAVAPGTLAFFLR